MKLLRVRRRLPRVQRCLLDGETISQFVSRISGCPRTHSMSVRPVRASYRLTIRSIRSRFSTGLPSAFFHPRRRQPGAHCVIDLMTYDESDRSRMSASGPANSRAEIMAVSSMMLFVVCGDPPAADLPEYCSTHAQPPGPGLPEQEPSVAITKS